MKVTYVVLHYMALNDTIECVESILENVSQSNQNETEIVIVDNGSVNHSYEELEKKFGDISKVHLLRSDKNLGFAKGNNLGFSFAKKKLHTDFIVLLNNDTIMQQKGFTEKLIQKYEEKKYSVLGPDIVTKDGYHQNPGTKQAWSLSELRMFRIKKLIRLFLSYLSLDNIIENIIEKQKDIYSKEVVSGDVENTILHGACMIFSPIFINFFDGLCDKTFLYMEEDILKLYSDFYGFLMMYSSELMIYHKEDVATNMLKTSAGKRARFKYMQSFKSSLVYSSLKKSMMKGKADIL